MTDEDRRLELLRRHQARAYGYFARVSPAAAGELFRRTWLRALAERGWGEGGRAEDWLWALSRETALEHLQDGRLSLVDHRRQALIYEAGGMSPEAREQFERHAALCPDCAGARERAHAPWSEAPALDPPADVLAAVRAAARARRARSRALRGALLAALAGTALAAGLWRRQPPPPPWETDLDERLARLEQSAVARPSRRRAETLRRRRSDEELARLALARRASELEAALDRRFQDDLRAMEVSLANAKTARAAPPEQLAALKRELEERRRARRAIVRAQLERLLRD